MKVVLFCGGQGTRLRNYSETIPKPMVQIGKRPILWHIMKYYSYYGHNEFILAMGYKSRVIKDFFLNYTETDSNDFVFSDGGRCIELQNSDIQNWKITFVDTGVKSNIGMRLMKVKDLIGEDEQFLANYSDGVTDMNLPLMIKQFNSQKDKIASFMTYQPKSSLHSVEVNGNNEVTKVQPLSFLKMWLNAGFFIFKKEIFNYIEYGDELVEEPFERLIKDKKLITHQYEGFWQPMDTFKDKMLLDSMYENGNSPWEVWNNDKK